MDLVVNGHNHQYERTDVIKDGKQNETVTWSRVRYPDYSFPRVDVSPAPKGHLVTLKVRGIAETGDQVDRFTVARRAK